MEQQEFIIIAGDCFHKVNNNTLVEETTNYIHELISASSCGANNVYITPGNHDLIRTDVRLAILNNYTGINYSKGEKEAKCRHIDSEAQKLLLTD